MVNDGCVDAAKVEQGVVVGVHAVGDGLGALYVAALPKRKSVLIRERTNTTLQVDHSLSRF